MIELDAAQAAPARPPFGRWLIAQDRSVDASADVRALATAARLDPKFPRDGSPEKVSAHLNAAQASQEMHEAFEQAETDWRYA